jgi:glycosyltransferase involved in cell wall biosynthesis
MDAPKVAIDARWIQDQPLDGVGRYLANLLPLVAPEFTVHLLFDSRRPPRETDLPATYLRSAFPSATTWIESPAVRWLRGFDGIFYTPWYGLPLRQPVPMVVTIHDIVFETHPEWFRPGRYWPFRIQARRAARTAVRILTPSTFVREQILDRYQVAPERVVAAPHGIDPVFTPNIRPQALAELAPGLEGTRYIVALGGAQRRQVDVSIEAWRRLRRAGIDDELVVIGGESPPNEPGLRHMTGLSDQAWATLLAGARALVYPTLFEGFGMPASEAMASGTPVVCAPVAALPEVLGESAQWCESPSVDSIAAGLIELLTSDQKYRQLRDGGLARARTMTWQASAAVMTQAFRDASEESKAVRSSG